MTALDNSEYSEVRQGFEESFHGNPNADAVVEGADGIFRRTANRYDENTKSEQPGGSKSYLSYWYGGPKGELSPSAFLHKLPKTEYSFFE